MEEEWISYSGMFVVRNQSLVPLSIMVSKPFKTEHDDYRCDLKISGLAKDFEEHLYGNDGVQALCIALNMAKSLVENSSEFRDGLIVHEDETPVGPLAQVVF